MDEYGQPIAVAQQGVRYQGQAELGRGSPAALNGLRIDMAKTASVLEEDSPQESPDEEDQFSDDLSSSPSVPSEDIDFDQVYALHTFLATVEGQASVSKGDNLTLLDDSNSYWWLVRVLKTQAVGYIPAENIETPYERLARLNKHRNVDLAGITSEDHLTGPTSTTAVARITPPVHVHKSRAHLPPKVRPAAPPGGRSVAFTAPTYYEHSGFEYTTEEEFSNASGEFDDGGFEDEEEEEEHDEEREGVEDGLASDRREDESNEATITPNNARHHDEDMDAEDEDERDGAEWEQEQRRRARSQANGHAQRSQAIASQQRAALAVAQSAEIIEPSIDARQQQYQQQQQQQLRSASPSERPQSTTPTPQTVEERRPSLGDQTNSFTQGSETRKISLTPRIASEDSDKQNRHRSTSTTSTESTPVRRSREEDREPEQQQQEQRSPGSPAKKLRKSSQGSISSQETTEDDKKKKKGGMFSGLFKKKDKKDPSNGARSSEETQRANSPAERSRSPIVRAPTPPEPQKKMSIQQQEERESSDAYLADQTIKQQQIEAKQAMYNQFGISRGPGDPSNTFTGRSSSGSSTLSPTSASTPARPTRPGSLIGSPGMTLDVPDLSVLRVFAGDRVQAEATFKTVLLSEATSTTDLLRQALQRFRLPLDQVQHYYLSVREQDGEERLLGAEQKPLVVVEELGNASAEPRTLPSVKRSSVSSITSVSSNISMHPAIAKLGMGDYSDDHLVKIYINRRNGPLANRDSREADDSVSLNSSHGTVTNAGGDTPRDSVVLSSPSMRFAIKVVIHPHDLPDGMAFDPQSQAIIPKSHLNERQTSPSLSSSQVSQHVREKILFFPANANISEVIETSLDHFGVVGGVVDGGDQVEDKLSKRRSISRVRYRLAAADPSGQESNLHPSSRLLDAYVARPPLFKTNDKAARRRSSDSSFLLGSSGDVQTSDPLFILRNAHPARHRPHSERLQQQAPVRPSPERNETAQSSVSLYATPMDEPSEAMVGLMPQEQHQEPPSPLSRQEIIAAQRAATRANQQHAMLSAQKNTEQGVDILLRDKGTIRSSREIGDNAKVRYSYIDNAGAEYDISEIVEAEWQHNDQLEELAAPSLRRLASHASMASETPTVMSSSTDRYESAPESPQSRLSDSEDEDQAALHALKSAPMSIGGSASPGFQKNSSDFLQDALKRPQSSSPSHNENLDDRINRVLAKVKNGRSASGIASALRMQKSGTSGRSSPASGRSSPANSRAKSPAIVVQSSSSRVSSPASQPRSASTDPRRPSSKNHRKQSSVNSNASDQSSVPSNYAPSTTTTAASGMQSFTTVSPNTRNGSSMSHRPVYRDDFGLDFLLAVVNDASLSARKPRKVLEEQPGMDELFGPDLVKARTDVNDPRVLGWFDQTHQKVADIESGLDKLLLDLMSTQVAGDGQ